MQDFFFFFCFFEGSLSFFLVAMIFASLYQFIFIYMVKTNCVCTLSSMQPSGASSFSSVTPSSLDKKRRSRS